MKLLLTLLVILLTFSIVSSEEAYFAFKTHGSDHDFVFKLTDPEKIKTARKILSGDETETTHVMGRFKKTQKPYNPHYSFHLDPDQISFFQLAIEVCDANLGYVEEHLDEACGAFLPGCFYCPWSSKITREVHIK
ncbi:hypothetical protein DICPUDRAFT_158479 [Dictyostelium purpureum]|uniref:BP74 N-terminal domain-containing protein n=1 Tax=Dictyostelium purpureum TaxID=5786 RepID=F1A1Q1_DICPU|nr:uncharacterized protein DICPUDRAFT_158479 [Dictyostelium purpureum]EGC29878.1 hypothetical protein DICPUDRAFT_158479 [Dictyostelium purpureum]|eukprot:XP_003293597.1 hypothetical protein DICPUDRAFT_158479 [Dictyostelium purpureum]